MGLGRWASGGIALKLKRAFLQGGARRQQQERIDVNRLFLLARLHEQLRQGGRLPEGFAEHVVEEAQRLPFEQQQQAVHTQLRSQLSDIGRCIHEALVQVGDPRPAATALEQAWQRLHGQASSSGGGGGSGGTAAQAATLPLVSQRQLSGLVQQRLGYSLAVQPSRIQHQEAGMGLFVQGSVPPGALLALFPGLVYSRESYRRMPGYPRLDAGNPYLTSRYDGGIVDSMPWGRGWAADGEERAKRASAAAAAAAPPARKGLLSRMVEASDGPRRPIPDTTWVRATTAEAADLELLEGRHPLALAHFANHPPAGAAPNAAIASFSFGPVVAGGGGGGPVAGRPSGAAGGRGGDAGAHGAPEAAAWLRAYGCNIGYVEHQCSPEYLLTHEVPCVALVAVRLLADGEEVLFNYRLSPAPGRPAWYVPVDAREENMRWA